MYLLRLRLTTRIVDRRTHWHPLSANVNNPMVCSAQEDPSSMLRVSAHDNIGVTVEGEVVVGRRLPSAVELVSGVHRPRPQATRPVQPSLASVGWAAAWPLVPRSRTLERSTLGSVRTFSTICNANVHTTRATRRCLLCVKLSSCSSDPERVKLSSILLFMHSSPLAKVSVRDPTPTSPPSC